MELKVIEFHSGYSGFKFFEHVTLEDGTQLVRRVDDAHDRATGGWSVESWSEIMDGGRRAILSDQTRGPLAVGDLAQIEFVPYEYTPSYGGVAGGGPIAQ